jgi:N-acetylglutamate synthase-like GNAT family acetyltransferase
MIRRCNESDFETIYEIINDAALAYRSVIPTDRWHEPYMSSDELSREISDGVIFWGAEQNGQLNGVMGIQDKAYVTLIRHAYVRTGIQKQGIGTQLLHHFEESVEKPILIGTWADASWAIAFYQANGYQLVTPEEKTELLKKYWAIPDRQIETSVVLADSNWIDRNT